MVSIGVLLSPIPLRALPHFDAVRFPPHLVGSLPIDERGRNWGFVQLAAAAVAESRA
jgi:hypothetical protein